MEQTSGKSLALRESVMELFIEQKVDHENRPHFFTDGTPVWSKNYLKPYPANGGKWTYIHRYKK